MLKGGERGEEEEEEKEEEEGGKGSTVSLQKAEVFSCFSSTQI